MESREFLQQHPPVGDGSYDVELRLEQGSERVEQHRVIVGHQDSRARHEHLPCWRPVLTGILSREARGSETGSTPRSQKDTCASQYVDTKQGTASRLLEK